MRAARVLSVPSKETHLNKPLVRHSRLSEGLPYPLGATWDGLGVNFALFSAHATKVELCLFEDGGRREVERIE
jgi:isoamylase